MRTGATMRTRPPKAGQTVPAPGAALVLTALVLAPLLASPRIGRADGGTVLLRATRDGLDVTLFGAPSPLRVGRADLSVLVQDAASGMPRLDGTVALILSPPSGSGLAEIAVAADAARATNKLLRAASVDLPAAGDWRARVAIGRDGATIETTTTLRVEPPAPAPLRLWPWLMLPGVATALFAWREWLLERRPRGRD